LVAPSRGRGPDFVVGGELDAVSADGFQFVDVFRAGGEGSSVTWICWPSRLVMTRLGRWIIWSMRRQMPPGQRTRVSACDARGWRR